MSALTDGSEDMGCPITAQGNCKLCGRYVAHSGLCECRTNTVIAGIPPSGYVPASPTPAEGAGETVETDAMEKRIAGPNPWDPLETTAVHSSQARRLKRERNEARRERDDWEKLLDEQIKVAADNQGECGRLMEVEIDLRAKLAQLQTFYDQNIVSWKERTKQMDALQSELALLKSEREELETILGKRSHDLIGAAKEAMMDIAELRTAPTGQEQELREALEKAIELAETLVDSFDYVGTGTSHGAAAAERDDRKKLKELKAALATRPAGPSDGEMLDWLENRIVKVSECMASETPELFEHVPAGYGVRDDTSLRKSITAAMPQP